MFLVCLGIEPRRSSGSRSGDVGDSTTTSSSHHRQHSPGHGSADDSYNLSGSTEQEQIEQLLLDLKLKNADNRFLQEEVMTLRSQIERKDSLLNVLTNGLKDVSLT